MKTASTIRISTAARVAICVTPAAEWRILIISKLQIVAKIVPKGMATRNANSATNASTARTATTATGAKTASTARI